MVFERTIRTVVGLTQCSMEPPYGESIANDPGLQGHDRELPDEQRVGIRSITARLAQGRTPGQRLRRAGAPQLWNGASAGDRVGPCLFLRSTP